MSKNIINISEIRDEKEGKVTPRSLLEDCMQNIDSIEQFVIIGLTKDDEVLTGWSDGSKLQALGLCDIGKMDIINAMEE